MGLTTPIGKAAWSYILRSLDYRSLDSLLKKGIPNLRIKRGWMGYKWQKGLHCKLQSIECHSLWSQREKNISRVSSLLTAEEVWDLLEVTHEGTNLVKQSKLQMLTSRFKTLRMKEDEQFINFHTRLQDIVNSMRGLGEEIKDPKIIRKILGHYLRDFIPRSRPLKNAKILTKWNLKS